MPDTDKPWIVQGFVTMDATPNHPLLLPVGPFSTFDDATLFMGNLRPYWGEFEVVALTSPASEALRVVRPKAQQFLDRIKPYVAPPIPVRGHQKELIEDIVAEWATIDDNIVSDKLQALLDEAKEMFKKQ